MAKSTLPTILSILRLFELAGEMTSKQSIRCIKEIEHRPGGKIFEFAYDRTRYIAIIDRHAGDDEEYLWGELKVFYPDAKGDFIANAKDASGYGMPFRGKEAYLFEVTPEYDRLDNELRRRFPDITRSTLQKYIQNGYVAVGNETITTSSYKVTSFDNISLSIPPGQDHSDKELPIIYIDNDVVVVNKPEGTLTHSKGALDDEFTVATFFRRYTTNNIDSNRPGIVHRLDRATSGVIIGARHDMAAAFLKKQFVGRTVEKTYVAVVSGTPKTPKAMIDLPIERHPNKPSTFRVGANGKPASTLYEVLSSTSTHSLIKLQPHTGRTHQLRVHMQYINTPIAGDPLYNKNRKRGERMFLHAQKLSITIPSGKRVTFTAPVPGEFLRQFEVNNVS